MQVAYNTKPIVTDKDGNPISQYYNPDTDSYEPVKGAGGGSAVVLYNEDGTENNELSLLPILDKISQLTGTVIDEEARKSNELQRIALYNQISQMLANGELKGDKGDTGLGLEFNWQDTSLGVRVEGQTEYVYVDLIGPQGEQGPSGSIDNLNSEDIEDALGYTPADSALIGLLESLTTEQKANLVAAINEIDNKVTTHKAENAKHTVTKSIPNNDYNQAIELGFYQGAGGAAINGYGNTAYGVLLVQLRGVNIFQFATHTNEIAMRSSADNGANWTVWRGFDISKIVYGANTPEGSITANIGTLYLRTNGGANTTLYVKESGTGNVGWIAK